ncbi:hypothetical protein CC78DRAFT_601182 [Lojkania enalia]|uniref:MICOS complex subunit n=1 Tax=Lojkania enalia TaxID=147567 RepID=A0A9P4JXE2_9PLEO|nr:hypothetical protein CC78DRAFT_601182 [Didymosphaeria enalia]
MASRPLLRQAIAPATAAVAGTALLFYTSRQLHAEEPPATSPLQDRKPIYDDTPISRGEPSSPTFHAAPLMPSSVEPYRPTPTDRLAVQIGHVRMALYRQSTKAEETANNALTETLRLEHSLTSTIRSLAPPKESNEKVLPGALYVLVASMAGSIVTRNRNILLRATIPAAIGVGTAYAVLPLTMQNVGNLAWTYEQRFPAVAEAHLATKVRTQKFLETGKAHSAMMVGMVEDKFAEAREKLEDWVKNGK